MTKAAPIHSRLHLILGAIALSVLTPAISHAAGISLADSTLNGNDVFEFTASSGDLDFDVSFNSLSGVTLRIVLNADDSGYSQLTWSGLYANLGTNPWDDFHITLLGGPTFADINVAESLSGGGLNLNETNPGKVSLSFAPPESLGLLIGLPGAVNASQDWVVNLNGLGPGDSFDMELVPSRVPEPTAFVLTLSGLALLLALRLRPHGRSTRL